MGRCPKILSLKSKLNNSMKSMVHFYKVMIIILYRSMHWKENLEIGTPTFSQWGDALWRIFTFWVINFCVSVFIMSKYFFYKWEKERTCKKKNKNPLLASVCQYHSVQSAAGSDGSGCSTGLPCLPAWARVTNWADSAHVMRLPLNSSQPRHLNFHSVGYKVGGPGFS